MSRPVAPIAPIAKKNKCPGCYPVFQQGQEAHMEYPNGCLSRGSDSDMMSCEEEEEDEDEYQDAVTDAADLEVRSINRNLIHDFDNVFIPICQEIKQKQEEQEQPPLKKTIKPIFELPTGVRLDACAICLDAITGMINVTVTECGHVFHSSCLFMSFNISSDFCPMCRNELIEQDEASASEDGSEASASEDGSEEQDGSEDGESEYDIDSEVQVTLEQLATKLQNIGYTMPDLLKIMVGITSEQENKYTREFKKKTSDDLFDIIYGKIPLSERDTRSYASVVATQN